MTTKETSIIDTIRRAGPWRKSGFIGDFHERENLAYVPGKSDEEEAAIVWLFQGAYMFDAGIPSVEGAASNVDMAKRIADEHLREQGWVLE